MINDQGEVIDRYLCRLPISRKRRRLHQSVYSPRSPGWRLWHSGRAGAISTRTLGAMPSRLSRRRGCRSLKGGDGRDRGFDCRFRGSPSACFFHTAETVPSMKALVLGLLSVRGSRFRNHRHRPEYRGGEMDQFGSDRRELEQRLLCYQVFCTHAPTDSGAWGFGPGNFKITFPHYTGYLGDRIRGVWRFFHEDYLQTLIEWGWVGASVWALVFLGGIAHLWRKCQQKTRSLSSAVFDSLLNEKRRRAFEKRANVLSFLSRCLTFVQVSPKILRKLVDEALLPVLDASGRRAPDLDPLAYLLLNAPFTDASTVEDELRSQLDARLVGSDEHNRHAALSLVAVGTALIRHGSQSAVNSDISEEWSRFFDEYADENRELYQQYVIEDNHIGSYMVRREWISAEGYLVACSEGLAPLAYELVPVIGGVSYVSPGYEMVSRLSHRRWALNDPLVVSLRERALRRLESVGAYLSRADVRPPIREGGSNTSI